MGKKIDSSAYNAQLTAMCAGTKLAFLTAEPANYAGMTKLMEATLTAASNSAADGTSGSYTFAAGTANAQGNAGRKVTIAAQTALTATGTGICTHVALHDNASKLLFVDTVGPVTQTGTAQAGAASTITLAAAASATDSIYNGYGVRIVSGQGAGQDRIITGYVGSTKVATVGTAWTTQPNATSVYEVFGFAITNGATYNTNAVTYDTNQPT